MEIIEYKNLEWHVINETDKEKLLFLRDSFTDEQVLKYFTDKGMIDEYFDVKFSKKISPWFIDSYIRKILNGPFLNDLDKNDLNIMKTTLKLNNATKISEDYVRLITKEEVETLQKTDMEVLKTKRRYGYWTMTPWSFNSVSSMYVFRVDNPGYLDYYGINAAYAVRPVISLKPDSFRSDVSLESDEIQKAILKFRKVTKC